MAVFLIDGGYFVGRFQKHNYTKKNRKNMNWWKSQYNLGRCSESEMLENCKRIFDYDITYLHMKMEEMGIVDKVIICYDGIFGRRGRGKIYKDYKRNRAGINATKHKGIDVRKKISSIGINPNSMRFGWESEYHIDKEADDLLAELAIQYSEEGYEVVVMSKDSDLYQITSWNENIKLHDFTKEITKNIVLDKTGVSSDKYVDWKSLSGDSSDNIPGMIGIGPAKAKKIINEFNKLENIPDEYFVKDEVDYKKVILDYKSIIELPFNYN
jgi:5'-3' exonuclease|tara:strand:- start:2047 stop:2853 length:807 start_codon:yes stop_codon:yes gene_type:complete